MPDIRPATLTNYTQLMELYNWFVGSDRYSNHESDSFELVLEEPNSFVFVLDDGQKLVGFVAYSIRRVVRYPKPIAELEELFVSPELRGQGWGAKLLEFVTGEAKDKGCYRMYIESHYQHEVAHKLYEKLGFANYGFHFVKNL
jgi:PhnO protein